MPGQEWTRSGSIEKVWALGYAFAVGLFFVVLAISVALGSYGVVLSEGEFLLIKGRARQEVDQNVGLAFFLLTYTLLVVVVGVILLSLVVFLRQGTLRPEKLFPRGGGDQRLVDLIRLSWALCVLPLLAGLLRAFL